MTQLVSMLTCPKCGGETRESMPTDACQYRHCGDVLRPLKGDCCVFCSYGDVPCPPIQEARSSGHGTGCCSA